MTNPPDFLREALQEFRGLDASLSSHLELHKDEASKQQVELNNKAENANRLVTNCWLEIQGRHASNSDVQNFRIALGIEEEIGTLKEWLSDIQNSQRKLRQIDNQLQALNADFKRTLLEEQAERDILERKRREALLKEKSDRRRRNARRAGILVVVLVVAVALHFWLLGGTTLSFLISIHEASPQSETVPTVFLDGKPFSSGKRITLGHHFLSVDLQDMERLQREFWAFYGKTDLGILPLEASKGSLSVTVTPSPASILVQCDGKTCDQGDAPLRLENLRVGAYLLRIRRGDYQENHSVRVDRQRLTETNIVLYLGSLALSADPADAEFELAGNGRSWHGTLPVRIDDAPVGTYHLTTRRKGWEIDREVAVSRGSLTSDKTEFQYGSIEVTSDPSGLAFLANGAKIGTTPTTLRELKPGKYTLSATDGENDLLADVSVAPKETAKHTFSFHYGIVHLSSTPTGASVIRKNKEVGKTPFTLEHIPVEPTMIELRLEGYASTNIEISAREGSVRNCNVKLLKKRYLAEMESAQQALEANQFELAVECVARALESEPNDFKALALKAQIEQGADQWRKQQLEAERAAADAKVRALVAELGAMQSLRPEYVVQRCWNTPTKSNGAFSTPGVIDAAHNDPLAVPWVATADVIVKGVELIKLPFHKNKTKMDLRFNNAEFRSDFQMNTYRYYGTIANVDLKSSTITFTSGGTSKQRYAVSASFTETISPGISLRPGARIWVAGKLNNLEEADPANRLVLVNCKIYPPNTLPPDK
jgi:hypothetical protein